MGIQSTAEIARNQVIQRIYEIQSIVQARGYERLKEVCFEPDYDVESFISTTNLFYSDVHNWSNSKLKKKIDEPFYRFSMFENYQVVGE